MTWLCGIGLALIVFGMEPFAAWKNKERQPILSCYFGLLKWIGLRKITYREGVIGEEIYDVGCRYVWKWSKEWKKTYDRAK